MNVERDTQLTRLLGRLFLGLVEFPPAPRANLGSRAGTALVGVNGITRICLWAGPRRHQPAAGTEETMLGGLMQKPILRDNLSFQSPT